MAIRCVILLLWITIGTSAQGQDCFYSQKTKYQDGNVVESIQRYDCNSPPKAIIIEKEVPSKDRGIGEFLFGVEESNQSVSKLFEVIVSLGVL